MSFGFVGIQVFFALQNSNTSRIFQILGASMDDIPALWMAAPLSGLIVQPIVGYLSDRTWTRLGRRRPYILVGAVLTALSLVAMSNARTTWTAAAFFWVAYIAINITMEPFRALVGDQLAPQRSLGFVMQSFFAGVGAIIASALPWLLAHAGIANAAATHVIPDTVKYSFYVGTILLCGSIGWTVLFTREYPPEAPYASFQPTSLKAVPAASYRERRAGLTWMFAGLLLAIAIWHFGVDRQLYLLAGMAAGYGLTRFLATALPENHLVNQLLSDVRNMPVMMRKLAVVQFFTWFATFATGIYMTAAVTQTFFATTDSASAAYGNGANWVGILFAAESGFAILATLILPTMVRHLGLRSTHFINLCLGGLGLLTFLIVRDSHWLLASMAGVGCTVASTAIPYTLLAVSVPTEKMGAYMGIFNIFIVIPQLLVSSTLAFLLRTFFGNMPLAALAISGMSLLVAALFTLRIRDEDEMPYATPARA